MESKDRIRLLTIHNDVKRRREQAAYESFMGEENKVIDFLKEKVSWMENKINELQESVSHDRQQPPAVIEEPATDEKAGIKFNNILLIAGIIVLVFIILK